MIQMSFYRGNIVKVGGYHKIVKNSGYALTTLCFAPLMVPAHFHNGYHDKMTLESLLNQFKSENSL